MTIDLDAAPPTRPPARGARGVAGVAVLVAAAVLVAVRLGGTPPPSSPPLPENLPGRLRWVTALVDGPPRGSVTADASFARDLATRVEELSGNLTRADVRPPDTRRARVLFAEDIDDRRIVLVALLRPDITDAIRRYALAELLWLAGPRGAEASMLAGAVAAERPAGSAYRLGPVAPFAWTGFGDPADPLWVGIAPPSCRIATAPAADLTAWRDEPGGSYLVRRPRQDGPEYWRVTCAGVVREERPAPRLRVSDDELDALASAGDPRRAQLESQISQLTSRFGSAVVTRPDVVWSGGLAFSPIAFDAGDAYYDNRQSDVARRPSAPIEATITIITARYARGGFLSSMAAVVREGTTTIWTIDSEVFRTGAHPGAPGSLVAVRVDRWRWQVLVLAPARAATLRILSEDGTVLDQSAAAGDQPVMLSSGALGPVPDLRVEALDASGAVIATTELASTDVAFDLTTAWE